MISGIFLNQGVLGSLGSCFAHGRMGVRLFQRENRPEEHGTAKVRRPSIHPLFDPTYRFKNP